MKLEERLVPPAVGPLMPRRRIAVALERGRPSLLLIQAPSGFGKTSVAWEFARTSRFEKILWFDAQGQELDQRGLLQFLLWQAAHEDQYDYSDSSIPSLEQRLADMLADFWSSSTCLVVDNVEMSGQSAAIGGLERVLRSVLRAGFCLVITSRCPLQASAASGSWSLEAADLRLAADEALEYATLQGIEDSYVEDVSRLCDAASGHIALLAVMLRSIALRRFVDFSDPARDVAEQLRHLVDTELGSAARRTFLAATLLGSGSTADVQGVVGSMSACALSDLADRIPLLRLDPAAEQRFVVHDVLRAVFEHEAATTQSGELLDRVLDQLIRRGDYIRAFELLFKWADPSRIEQVLEVHGRSLLEQGALSLLRCLLRRLPEGALIRRPRLLLLLAHLDKIDGRPSEARHKARLVTDLAEHEGMSHEASEARRLLGRLLISEGRCSEAYGVLEHSLELASDLKPFARAAMLAHMAAASAAMGRGRRAGACLDRASAILPESGEQNNRARALLSAARGFLACSLLGDYEEAVSVYSKLSHSGDLGVDMRFSACINEATALCARGRLDRAGAVLDQARQLAETTGAFDLVPQIGIARSEVLAGRGEYEMAEAEIAATLSGCDVSTGERSYALSTRACWRRAEGRLHESLADAEEAKEEIASTDMVPLGWKADLEIAATLLAMGDGVAASQTGGIVIGDAMEQGAMSYAGTAGLLLLCAAQESSNESRLPDSLKKYLRAGNLNWQAALYIRAFPRLLVHLVELLGTDHVPAHLLQMLRERGKRAAVAEARVRLPLKDYQTLRQRLGEADRGDREPADDDHGACQVRVFGGFEVVASGRRVLDQDWQKRKARLLFAMLVVRKGRDVPREQLLEYLWPEMDSERAVANFYVVWNRMKNALSPGLQKGATFPYARAAGGVCRVDDLLVRSDLDDFEQCLVEGRRAESERKTAAALASYTRLCEIYRGDLLPGDVYDDWFAPLRERCRQEFGDAMLRGAQLFEQSEDFLSALRLTRAALSHEPWREDLYQAALRCQIASGQRSAAVETYMTCRHKLAEDLGLDPSAETRRLYDQVLSMEDSGETPYSG